MKNIKLVILDIDGVLTDGTKYYDSNANVIYKCYNDKDFTAIKRIKASNIEVCFLSGDNNVNEAMAKKRNIKFYSGRLLNGVMSKKEMLKTILNDYNVTSKETIYVGDDIFDIEVMNEVSLAFCPNDSPKIVKDNCICLDISGGKGVISYLFEYLLNNDYVNEPNIEIVKKIDSCEK